MQITKKNKSNKNKMQALTIFLPWVENILNYFVFETITKMSKREKD